MCTVVVASRVVAGVPLVVIANRDERLARPASPPSVWPGGFVAPRDEKAGGTWLGVNADGVFVGITNRHLASIDERRRSRGAIVVEALAKPTARAVHEAMRALDPSAYNGFHLVYADRDDVLATVSDGRSLAQLTLGRGRHAITERSFGAGDDAARLRRIDAAWERLGHEPESLRALLTEHDATDPFGSTCIHLPDFDYGTRSSMVLFLGPKNGSTMLWAEGPPCTTPFVPAVLPSWRKTG